MSQYRATWLGNTSAVLGSPRFAKSLRPIIGIVNAIWQGLAFFRIVKFAVFTQDQTMIRCILDYLWGPMYAALHHPRHDRHDHPIIGADVFKPAEDPRGNVENILFQCHFAASPLRPQKKRQRPERTKNTPAVL